MQIKFGLNPPSKTSNPLRKLAAFVLTAVMLGFLLMFSAALLVVILVVGTLGWAYLWWKTRELRKQMRSFQQQAAAAAQQKKPNGDNVFEGEVIRVVEPPDGK
jgi:hypothetical protein